MWFWCNVEIIIMFCGWWKKSLFMWLTIHQMHELALQSSGNVILSILVVNFGFKPSLTWTRTKTVFFCAFSAQKIASVGGHVTAPLFARCNDCDKFAKNTSHSVTKIVPRFLSAMIPEHFSEKSMTISVTSVQILVSQKIYSFYWAALYCYTHLLDREWVSEWVGFNVSLDT